MRTRTPRTRDILAFPVLALAACAPTPDATESCPAGSVLDGATCVPEACATGTWGAVEVDADTVYVDAAAEPGGDGSAERPLQSVQAGADVAAERGGRLVAIASGTYTESLMLGSRHDGLTLAGRCAEGVVLDASGAEGAAIRVAREDRGARPRVALTNLTVTGGTGGGVHATNADLDGTRLRVVDNGTFGVFLERSTTRLAESTVARTRNVGRYGSGIWVQGGTLVDLRDVTIDDAQDGLYAANLSELRLDGFRVAHTRENPCLFMLDVESVSGEDVLLEDCTAGALYAVDGTVATLRDVRVNGTTTVSTSRSGYGIAAGSGAQLSIEDLLVTGSGSHGAYVTDAGSSLEIVRGEVSGSVGLGVYVLEGDDATDATVPSLRLEDVRLLDNGNDGMRVVAGARVTAVRVDIAGNGYLGMSVMKDGATSAATDVTLEDVRIADTRATEPASGSQPLGFGLFATGDVRIRGTDVELDGNHAVGATLREGASVHLTDCRIANTRPHIVDNGYGTGIDVGSGAQLRLEGCAIDGNRSTGILVEGVGTRLDLIDTRVSGTLRSMNPESAASRGGGVDVSAGATATLLRATIEDNPAHGLSAHDPGTRMEVTDTLVRGTYQTTAGTYGRGATVTEGGTMVLTRTTFADNVDIGVLSYGEGSLVEMRECVVEGTRRGRQGRVSFGVGTALGGTLHATDVEIHNTQGPGAYLHFRGNVRLERADLHDNTFAGAAVIGDGTLELIDSHVHDNGADLDNGGGLGVVTRQMDGAPNVRIERTEIGQHAYAALWFDGPGSYTVRESTLAGGSGVSRSGRTLHGNALVALRGIPAASEPYSDGLHVSGTTLRDSLGAAVLLDGASMRQDGNVWLRNTTDVLQQRCDTTTPLLPEDVADIPSATVCPAAATLVDTALTVPLYVPGNMDLND